MGILCMIAVCIDFAEMWHNLIKTCLVHETLHKHCDYSMQVHSSVLSQNDLSAQLSLSIIHTLSIAIDISALLSLI